MDIWNGKKGVFLIAEIGGNHEGDFGYAKKLTSLAIGSGVDAVKFQVYFPESLVNCSENPARYEHFRRSTLKPEEHIHLAKMCIEGGVQYMASVWDIASLDWIDEYIQIYKIGSGDLTAYPIIKAITEKKKPIILATGMSTLEEIKDTVEYIYSIDEGYKEKNKLALLQCTSAYPTPPEDVNLKAMSEIERLTGLPVGYSDHTTDHRALETAVALGARILEFHFTDTREGKEFRDHAVSLTKEEVLCLRNVISDINVILGDGNKRVMPSEKDGKDMFRRGVYPARDMEQAKVVEKEDLVCLRPNNGIDARDHDMIIGKRTVRDLKKLEQLNSDLFE